MDLVTHAASGALAMLAMPQRPATRWALPLAAFAAAAPDLDILAASGPLQTLLLHRGITHALAAAPLMGLLLAILARPLWRYDTRNAWSFGGVWAFMMLLVLLHIWLDALTTYGTLVWPGGDHREWLVTLPRFPQLWALVIYVFLSGNGAPPLLRLLALGWWFLLCVAPVNTGMVGYADILGPLVIIALVLGCMHLAEKRASRQTRN